MQRSLSLEKLKTREPYSLAALEDERRKRQQLEESLNETRGKMTELESLRDEIKQWRESQVYR